MIRIAVIQTAFPGDVILSSAVFEALKQQNQGCYTAAVVRPESACLLKSNPYIDDIIIYDKYGVDKGILGIWRISSKIKRFDEAIIIQRHFRSALIPFLAHIPKRVGFDVSSAAALYTEKVKYGNDLHEVQRCLKLIGIDDPQKRFKPRIVIDDAAKERAERLLKDGGIGSEFVAVAPGSVWATKRYSYYAQLIDLIYDRFKFPVVLIGGFADSALASEICKSTSHKPYNLSGKTDLLQSAAIIARAKLAISNDSAPAHIASAVETPVVVIFGSTVPSFGFAPYSVKSEVVEIGKLYCRPCGKHGRKKCPEGHFRCMNDLSPEKIIETASLLLSS
jgi:heptosyltransferase II